MIKKLAMISICLLIGVSMTAATPRILQQTTETTVLDLTGTFDGNIGYKRQDQNATIVGTISGTYGIRNRGGIFTGDWVTGNRTGTFKGGFGRHILVGKIITVVNGTEKSLPIVGFYGGRNGQFIGRFMAPVGPALYFWGNYT
jgi:hypothetical protein